MESHTSYVCYHGLFTVILLLFATSPLNVCQSTKGNVGIVYDPSTEISQHTVKEYTDTFDFFCSPIQLYWWPLESSSSTSALRKVWSQIGSDIRVLISAVRCPQLTRLSAMAETLQIPHLALNIDTCYHSRNETYTIHLVNQLYYLPKLIAKIAELERWNKVLLGINDMFVRRHTRQFVQELSKAGIESVLWNEGGVINAPWIDQHNTVVITKNISRIQHMVNKIRPVWIIVTERCVTNTDLVQTASLLPEDILLIRPKVQCSQSHTGDFCNNTELEGQLWAIINLTVWTMLFIDSNTSTASNVAQMEEGQSFSFEVDHLFDKIAQNLHQLPESETPARYGINQDCLGEFEILKLSMDNASVRVVGEWSLTNGFVNHGAINRPFMSNLGGITLRLGVIGTAYPFSNLTVGTNNSYDGLVVDILDHVAMDLDFRYTLVESVDGYYGHPLDNGTWTGVIGMMLRQEVVFGAGLFTVNMERSEVVDFVMPFMETSLAILTFQQNEQTDVFQFVKPFSTNVWVLLLVFGISTCITLVGIIRLTEKEHRTDDQLFSKTNIVFDVLAAFLEQGVPAYPHSISARSLLANWSVFSLLIVAIYTAHLTAVLTVNTPIKNIDSLKDLSERTDLEVIVLGGSSYWMLFESSKDPVYQKIYSQMVAETTVEDTIQKVLSNKACYIQDTAYLQYIVSLLCGKVRIAKEKFQHQFFSFPIPKNSRFKTPIGNSLQKMMEGGIIEMLSKNWLDRTLYCNKGSNEENHISMLTVDRLCGVFLMFIGFVALAVISCIAELILFQFFRKWTSPSLHWENQ